MSNHAQDMFGNTYPKAEGFWEELAQMQLVCDAETGGGYEWDVFLAYYHAGRDRFYFISGGGCSCNWISDGVYSLEDFQDAATKQDVARHFRAYVQDTYGWHRNEIESVVQEILNFRKNAAE